MASVTLTRERTRSGGLCHYITRENALMASATFTREPYLSDHKKKPDTNPQVGLHALPNSRGEGLSGFATPVWEGTPEQESIKRNQRCQV
jgi:hypothetical protein